MDKKVFNIVCTMIVVIFTICLSTKRVIADSTTGDGFKYIVNNNGISITRYSGNAEDVIIPDKIEDLLVTSIGDCAFYDCKKLKSIVIPDTVTSIGNDAFHSCENLTGIRIPNSVTSIDNSVFRSCENLRSIIIPNGVTKIGDDVFQACSKLTSIMIPSSVTSIGHGAFYNCENLDSVIIPNSVTSIGDYAFENCSKLTSMMIPNSVIEVGNGAFKLCSNLKNITISNSAVSIGRYAFNDSGITTGSSITMYKNFNDANIKNTIDIGINIPIIIKFKDPIANQNLEASADTLVPTAGTNSNITLSVKDSAGNLQNTSTQAIFKYDEAFNVTTTVAISGVTQAQNGSYGSITYDDGSGNKTLQLNLDSASQDGQEFKVKFMDGQAKFKLMLESTTRQAIEFRVDGIVDSKTPILNMTPVLNKDPVEPQSSTIIPTSTEFDNDSTPTRGGNGGGPGGSASSVSEFKSITGNIVDEVSGKSIEGAKVNLYYANTERNKAAGKAPDTAVYRPEADEFKSNNNGNLQLSDSSGAYGFRAFSNKDYYIVAEKNGYNKYISPTISVGHDIAKLNFGMHIFGVERLYGQDRIDTNIQVTKAAFPSSVSNVILASSENYPDALSGSVLSYKLNAPILLVGRSKADRSRVFSYLKDNMSTCGTVYILGGTGSIDKDIVDKISESGFKNIVRIGGRDRYETTVKIDDKIGAKEGTPIVVVSGENYPDALSISSIAAQNGHPIFMTPKDKIPDGVKKEISNLKPSKVYIIGLEGVISKDVENQILNMTSLDSKKIIRIGGKDRFETSLDIAKYFNLSSSIECVSSGNNYPDALSGSIYAAKNKAHVVLVGDKLSESATEYFKNSKLSGITIFGGTGAVTNEVQEEISKAISK